MGEGEGHYPKGFKPYFEGRADRNGVCMNKASVPEFPMMLIG